MPARTYKLPNEKVCVDCGKKFFRPSGTYSDKDWAKRKYCSIECGRKHFSERQRKMWEDPQYREAMRRVHSGPRPERRGKPNLKMRGPANHRWMGGITGWQAKIRTSLEYKSWRREVFERDGYTCQMCGAHSGNGKAVELHADHIKPFALHPELRFALINGRTLCKTCHRKTDTFGGRTSQGENRKTSHKATRNHPDNLQ